MTEQQNAVTTSFWVIAGLALVWNLIGVMAYLADVMQTPQDIAAQSQVVQDLYAMRPAWAVAAFAVAVFGGALGALMLLLRKRLAIMLFVVSLVGLLVQNFFWFGIGKAHEKFPVDSQIMPLVVFLIAVLLVWYSRNCERKGWLS